MNTTATTVSGPAASHTQPSSRRSPLRRFFGVVAEPTSYRNLGYLLVGLPLGTIWFSVLVSGISVAVSMLVVALLGIPMLLGVWYVTRVFANVERGVANVLLDQDLAPAPFAATDHGNLWVRLRAMTRDRDRWRELGYLMLRFPAGIATSTAAVTALMTPAMVAYAPIHIRYDDHPFGDWALSSRMEEVASSSWSWFLVPIGVMMLFGSFHLLNAIARACGRWTTASLGVQQRDTSR